MTTRIQTADQISGMPAKSLWLRVAADQVEILHYRLGLHPESQELRDAYQQAQAVLVGLTPAPLERRPAVVQEPLDRWVEWDELWSTYQAVNASLAGLVCGSDAHSEACAAGQLVEDQLRNFGVIHRAYQGYWAVEVQMAERDLRLPDLFAVTHTYRDGQGPEDARGALGRYDRRKAPKYAQGILAWITDPAAKFPV